MNEATRDANLAMQELVILELAKQLKQTNINLNLLKARFDQLEYKIYKEM
jgi:hypothetical protein